MNRAECLQLCKNVDVGMNHVRMNSYFTGLLWGLNKRAVCKPFAPLVAVGICVSLSIHIYVCIYIFSPSFWVTSSGQTLRTGIIWLKGAYFPVTLLSPRRLVALVMLADLRGPLIWPCSPFWAGFISSVWLPVPAKGRELLAFLQKCLILGLAFMVFAIFLRTVN